MRELVGELTWVPAREDDADGAGVSGGGVVRFRVEAHPH